MWAFLCFFLNIWVLAALSDSTISTKNTEIIIKNETTIKIPKYHLIGHLMLALMKRKSPSTHLAAVAYGFTYYAFQRCYTAYLGNVWLLESVLLSYQLKAGWPYCSYLWLQLGFFAQSTVTHWSDRFFFGSFWIILYKP